MRRGKFSRNIRRKAGRKRLLALFLLVFAAAAAVHIDSQVRAFTICRAESVLNIAMSDAAAQVLDESAQGGSPMVRLSSSGNGTLQALCADAAAVNNAKNEMAHRATARLSQSSTLTTAIPAGSLTGSRLLSGRGGSVVFTATAWGSVTAQLRTELKPADGGTVYEMYVDLTGHMTVTTGIHCDKVEEIQHILIGETVLP